MVPTFLSKALLLTLEGVPLLVTEAAEVVEDYLVKKTGVSDASFLTSELSLLFECSDRETVYTFFTTGSGFYSTTMSFKSIFSPLSLTVSLPEASEVESLFY